MLKTIIIVVVIGIAWTVFKSERHTNQPSVQQALSLYDKQQSAIKANVDLNQGLPTMLDSQTMLTKVEASTDSTVYHIKMVNYLSASLDEDFLIKAQELIGRRNCTDKDIKWSLDQGKYMKYILSGSDHQQAGSFIISKVYCQQFG